MTVGERIREARERIGMAQTELAARCMVTKQTLYKYEKNIITNIPTDTLERIASVLSVSPGYLVGWEEALPTNMQPLPGSHQIPRLGAIACGEPILAAENLDGYDSCPDWVHADFTLLCKGDSMIGAGIKDGDIVFIRQQAEVEPGQIAAVLIGDEATLKRVRPIQNGVALWPENPAYEPLVYIGQEAQDVRIIGLATHCLSPIR